VKNVQTQEALSNKIASIGDLQAAQYAPVEWMSRCAGVPMTRPVAGVAMGLMLEQDGQFKILTDILGSEDAMGDMDFKVAGDADAITAFQMDIKVRLM